MAAGVVGAICQLNFFCVNEKEGKGSEHRGKHRELCLDGSVAALNLFYHPARNCGKAIFSLFVCSQGSPHVIITHDALDLTV